MRTKAADSLLASDDVIIDVGAYVDPDIAILDEANNAVLAADYTATKAVAPNQAAALAFAKAKAEEIVAAIDNRISIAVTGNTFRGAINGTADGGQPTNGWFEVAFTLTLGEHTKGTAFINPVITAAPYEGILNNDAVAAADAAVVDFTLDVAYGTYEHEKRNMVEDHVNALVANTPDAAGVQIEYVDIPFPSKEEATCNLKLYKGRSTTTKTITVTFNIGIDPNIALVESAIPIVEGIPFTTTQEDCADQRAVEQYICDTGYAALRPTDITYSLIVMLTSYTPPTKGTSAKPEGTNGSYVFTLNVRKGDAIKTTKELTVSITATAYKGVSDKQAIVAAVAAVIDGEVNVAFGATQAEKTAAVQSYVESLLEGKVEGISVTITHSTGNEYKFVFSKGEATITGGVTVTINESQGPVIPVQSVALDKTVLSLNVGTTQTLTATITPSNATDKTVSWKSSDKSIATVSEAGLITAIKSGTAIITATTADGSKTAACTVTVTAVQPTVITIVTQPANKTALLNGTASFTVEATVLPEKPLSYKWYRSVGSPNSSDDVLLAESKTFIANKENLTSISGSYNLYCVISAEDGVNARTDTVTLTVRSSEAVNAPGGELTELTQDKADEVFGEGNTTVEGDNIHINNDIIVDDTIIIKVKPIVIDLGGNTISGAAGVSPVLNIDNTGNTTITGGGNIIGGTGTDGAGGAGVEVGSGNNVTIGGGSTITGGASTGGQGGNGVEGAVGGGNATITGGGNATGGNGGMSGNGGNGASAEGDVNVENGSAIGGNGSSGGGTGNGGTGANAGGNIDIGTNDTASGGNGANSSNGGGNGGAGTSTGATGETTVNGTVNGGNGGNATENGNGGNGGNGVIDNIGATFGGTGTVTGGNGGDGAGTGSGGEGGNGLSDGVSGGNDLAVNSGNQGRSATVTINDEDAGTTITVPNKQI